MSTLQSLLSKINVQQFGGAGAAPAVPPDAQAKQYSLGGNSPTDGRCHIKWSGKSDTFGTAELGANIQAIIAASPGVKGLPANMDLMLQGISDYKPSDVYTAIKNEQQAAANAKKMYTTVATRNAAQAGGTADAYLAATQLELGPNNKLRVNYQQAGQVILAGNNTTFLHGAPQPGDQENIGDYAVMYYLACMMHYVVDNTVVTKNAQGNLSVEDKGPTSTNNDYTFLAQGGVGAYATHLPTDIVSGLPGAMALAAYQPISLNPLMVMNGREGNVGQTGGGAFILSSAPSVRKYCADSNYLVQEVNRQLALMQQKGLKLTSSSEAKVKNLLAKLQNSEAELCKTHELLDVIIGSKEAGEDVVVNDTNGNPVKFDDRGIDLNDLNQAKDQLTALKRKLSVKALSTVLTLSDIVTKAVNAANNPNNPPGKLSTATTAATTGTLP